MEDCLVVTTSREPLILSSSRLVPNQGFWQIESDAPIDADRDGGYVVAVNDGQLIGVLVFQDGRPQVAVVPADL